MNKKGTDQTALMHWLVCIFVMFVILMKKIRFSHVKTHRMNDNVSFEQALV